MNNEEYNEKAQRLKVKIHELILSEYKYIDSRANYIDSLINELGEHDDFRVKLLNLKKDNEDSRALLSSFENMLKNRLTADEILRFSELFQGYMTYSDLITKDLEKYSSGKES